MLDRATLKHFGIQQRGWFRSQLHQVYEAEIAAAVDDNQLLAVVGPYGAGKSELVKGALRQLGRSTSALDVVWVEDPNRENQKISHVMNAAIYDLAAAGENPRRDAEARARQFARVVGERVVRQRRKVVIIIENAHRLHPMTLMAIKDSRESARFADHVGSLFSVILIGQGRLLEMLKKQPEIYYRSTVVELTEEAGWMTFEERVRYLEAVYADALTDATRRRLAERSLTPLALDAAVEKAMRAARRAGFEVVDERTIRLSLDELKDLTGVSLQDIARESGIPKATVGDVLKRGEDAHHASPAVREALERIHREQLTRAPMTRAV